jgi:hypothetical protein
LSVVGGFPERFNSAPAGAEAGGCCGRAGAAPVVVPGCMLLRGVTSRTPGATGGVDVCAVFGLAGVVCALLVPVELVEVLFSP